MNILISIQMEILTTVYLCEEATVQKSVCVLVCLMRLTAVCKFLGSMRYRLVIL